MKLYVKALGNCSGTIRINNQRHLVSRSQESFEIEIDEKDVLQIVSETGKLADSEDSFLFLYTKIDPNKENIRLSADFKVISDSSGWLSGYGLMAVDTIASKEHQCRFRNQLLAGRFKANTFHEISCGLRAIAGYADPEAAVDGGRLRDVSRKTETIAACRSIDHNEEFCISLSKTDTGFEAIYDQNGKAETLSFPGCDFLTKQDPEHIYLGIAAAGDISLEISGLRIETGSGELSHMPAEAIRSSFPEYPFSAALLKSENTNRRYLPNTVYVSPDGKADAVGSRRQPVDLETALNGAGRKKIILLDGIYKPDISYYITKENCGTPAHPLILKADHTYKAVIDGSSITRPTPCLILRGSYWKLEGLVFRNSISAGLFICGNNNIIEKCKAVQNCDTGILLCTYPGTGKDEWPHDNLIAYCDSHNNIDEIGSDADGFGAKLSIGKGNCFYECLAYENGDDGFDLYTKRTLGPIGEVLIENCVACGNNGSGFKLGGEGQPVCHSITNCLAYKNHTRGFAANSNPLSRLRNLISLQNGADINKDSFNLTAGSVKEPLWTLSGLLPEDSVYIVTQNRKIRGSAEPTAVMKTFSRFNSGAPPSRHFDGRIDLRNVLTIDKNHSGSFRSNEFFGPQNIQSVYKRKKYYHSLKKRKA